VIAKCTNAVAITNSDDDDECGDSETTAGNILLGHVSLLTDLNISFDGRFLATCDRDEKIRISHFPNAYNIRTFLLGHTSFVTSVLFLPNSSDLILSTGGDSTVRLWNISSGKQLDSLQLDDGIIPSKIVFVNPKQGTFFILLDSSTTLIFCQIEAANTKLKRIYEFQVHSPVLDAFLVSDNQDFIVLSQNEHNDFLIKYHWDGVQCCKVEDSLLALVNSSEVSKFLELKDRPKFMESLKKTATDETGVSKYYELKEDRIQRQMEKTKRHNRTKHHRKIGRNKNRNVTDGDYEVCPSPPKQSKIV